MNRKELVRIGYAPGEIFLQSFTTHPKAIVIDMDPTAVHCHGAQQLLLFNAHEDEYCLMPFHVYDGLTGKLITTTIRSGKTPTGGDSGAAQTNCPANPQPFFRYGLDFSCRQPPLQTGGSCVV